MSRMARMGRGNTDGMSDTPIPRLDPDALKHERHDPDLGSEADSAEFDRVARGDDAMSVPQTNNPPEPTAGATPPAR